MSKKKASFCCLVQGCDHLFWTNTERRAHLVLEHKYHPSYDFHNPKRFLQQYRKKSVVAMDQASDRRDAVKPGATSLDTVDVGSNAGQVKCDVNGSNCSQPNRAQRRMEKRMQYASTTDNASSGAATDNSTGSTGRVEMNRSGDSYAQEEVEGVVADEMGMEVQADDAGIEALTAGMCAVSVKVPRKISFGRRKRHGCV